MKTRSLLLIALMIMAASAVTLFSLNGQRVFAILLSKYLPTLAPTATPGSPPPNPTSVPLIHPLLSQDQALEQALQYDAVWSVWDHPWSIGTLSSEPGRITARAFQSRTAESADGNRNEGFSPEVEADAGAVWRITIKGNVHVNLISMDPSVSKTLYDSVTYVISQRTGNLLAIIAGDPVK